MNVLLLTHDFEVQSRTEELSETRNVEENSIIENSNLLSLGLSHTFKMNDKFSITPFLGLAGTQSRSLGYGTDLNFELVLSYDNMALIFQRSNNVPIDGFPNFYVGVFSIRF